MCDVCTKEGRDWKFHNGSSTIETCRLYRVYEGREAKVKLCKIHSIELFCIGESRFLSNHPSLALDLHFGGRSTSSNNIFAFS